MVSRQLYWELRFQNIVRLDIQPETFSEKAKEKYRLVMCPGGRQTRSQVDIFQRQLVGARVPMIHTSNFVVGAEWPLEARQKSIRKELIYMKKKIPKGSALSLYLDEHPYHNFEQFILATDRYKLLQAEEDHKPNVTGPNTAYGQITVFTQGAVAEAARVNVEQGRTTPKTTGSLRRGPTSVSSKRTAVRTMETMIKR